MQAVTDIDAGRAHLHTLLAIDTVAKAYLFRRDAFLALAARLAPVRVVGDDPGVGVKHHRLEPGIRAHVQADLLTHPAGVQVGGNGEEGNPEIGPAVGLQGEQVHDQFADRVEIANKGDAGGKGNKQPQCVFDGSFGDLFPGVGGLVEFHPLVAAAFHLFFNPHEDKGPHGLRAGVTTPDTAKQGSDEEQAEGADNQHAREQEEIFREEGDAVKVELAGRQVKVDQGLAVQCEPGKQEIHAHEHGQADVPDSLEKAFYLLHVNLFTTCVEVNGLCFLVFVVRGIGGWVNLLDRNLVTHGYLPV